ncbi:MAG: alpha/beta hydrolase [Cyclobacteriaceae bacterium]
MSTIKSLLMVLSLSLLFIGGAVSQSNKRFEVKEVFNVTYLKLGDRELKLDLFIPKNLDNKTPCIVGLHGGAWIKGNRRNFHRACRGLAERDYIAASVSYRLAGEAPFPAQIQDIQAAIRWLKKNAETYQIDPDRIGVAGFSAGGHLATLVASSGNSEGAWPKLDDLEGDAMVRVAIPMAAQSDLETDRIRKVSASEEQYFYRVFLSGSLSENPETYRLASPLVHLDKNDPPVAFICGSKDNESTRGSSYRSKMTKLGIDHDLLVIDGAPHVFLTNPQWYELAMDFMVKFLDKHLKN